MSETVLATRALAAAGNGQQEAGSAFAVTIAYAAPGEDRARDRAGRLQRLERTRERVREYYADPAARARLEQALAALGDEDEEDIELEIGPITEAIRARTDRLRERVLQRRKAENRG